MNFKFRKIIAFSLLLTILFGMVVVCNAADNAGTSISAIQQDTENPTLACEDCPCAPVKSQSNHNSKHACYSFCHASLAVEPLFFSFTRPFTYLNPPEIIFYTPKVYLSLFVPPDSAKI